METSMFAFANDLHDEGLLTVLENVQHRAGVNGLTIAVVYHDARTYFLTTRFTKCATWKAVPSSSRQMKPFTRV
jgi:hypothetical protein